MVRGDVHEIHLRRGRGRAQHGRWYAVIVQADELLALSTVVICPTSLSSPPASFHPEIEVRGESTKVLCEMLGVVDARRLGKQVGHVAVDEMAAIEDALSLVLDLPA